MFMDTIIYDGVALVDHVKSLGVILQQSLSYDLHVTEILKQCSQRVHLLRLLRNQGPPTDQMNTVFTGLIVSRLLYALPACGVLVSAGQAGRVDAFLKRANVGDRMQAAYHRMQGSMLNNAAVTVVLKFLKFQNCPEILGIW